MDCAWALCRGRRVCCDFLRKFASRRTCKSQKSYAWRRRAFQKLLDEGNERRAFSRAGPGQDTRVAARLVLEYPLLLLSRLELRHSNRQVSKLKDRGRAISAVGR